MRKSTLSLIAIVVFTVFPNLTYANPIPALVVRGTVSVGISELIEAVGCTETKLGVTGVQKIREEVKAELITNEIDVKIHVSGTNESRLDPTTMTKVSVNGYIPCKIRYSVDLKQVKWIYDSKGKKVYVLMPEVKMIEPVPDHEKAEITEYSIGFLRGQKDLDKLWENVRNLPVKNDAIQMGKDNLENAKQESRNVVKSYFEDVLKGLDPNIEVKIID